MAPESIHRPGRRGSPRLKDRDAVPVTSRKEGPVQTSSALAPSQTQAGLSAAGPAWLCTGQPGRAAVCSPVCSPEHRRPPQASGQKFLPSSAQKFQDSAGNSPGPSLEKTWGTLKPVVSQQLTGVLGSQGTAQEKTVGSWPWVPTKAFLFLLHSHIRVLHKIPFGAKYKTKVMSSKMCENHCNKRPPP